MIFIAVSSGNGFALTATDVTEKMTDKQRSGFLSGLVTMLAYQTARQGNSTKARCITDTFYRNSQDLALTQLVQILQKYPEKRPEILVSALASQLCKK